MPTHGAGDFFGEARIVVVMEFGSRECLSSRLTNTMKFAFASKSSDFQKPLLDRKCNQMRSICSFKLGGGRREISGDGRS